MAEAAARPSVRPTPAQIAAQVMPAVIIETPMYQNSIRQGCTEAGKL